MFAYIVVGFICWLAGMASMWFLVKNGFVVITKK